MVERCIKTVEEQLRKVVASHKRDVDERLHLFLLARQGIHSRQYWPSTAFCRFDRLPTLPTWLLVISGCS
jgi:hypothetical protein